MLISSVQCDLEGTCTGVPKKGMVDRTGVS
jgi:hypothetical protein